MSQRLTLAPVANCRSPPLPPSFVLMLNPPLPAMVTGAENPTLRIASSVSACLPVHVKDAVTTRSLSLLSVTILTSEDASNAVRSLTFKTGLLPDGAQTPAAQVTLCVG